MKQPTPKDGAPQDAGRKVFFRSMDAFLTLRTAIPHGTADQIGYDMGVTGITVRTWCREPETDEEMSTGRRSPLDRICDLLTAVDRVNPDVGPELILDHLRGHVANLKANKNRQAPTARELEEKLQQALMLITQIYDDLRAQRREKLQAVK